MAIPVLLDMDPGVDDALAILLAIQSLHLDVQAITVCGGNVGLDRCALNALKTLRVLGAGSVPVAAGAYRPVRRSPAPGSALVHGRDGLGDVSEAYPDPDSAELDTRHAVDVILEAARRFPDARAPQEQQRRPLTIVATGPLTNIALALCKDWNALSRVERIIWMGGAYACPGNVTAVAEFNAFCDPDAAQEVLSSGIPMTVVGLDATHQCALQSCDLAAALQNSHSSALRFAGSICRHYMSFHQSCEGQEFCYLHDPLAVGILIWPELVRRVEKHHVTVVCDPGPTWGMTVIDRRSRNPWINAVSRAAIDRVPAEDAEIMRRAGILAQLPHVDVVLDVDGEEFVNRFLAQITLIHSGCATSRISS